ncbi:DUF6922 domain-containing protein [Mucilaginibacter psychrotolerans]|uniref:DUF6922 domain-containing protein n=1 Tax=Mucilaginibacter psychrotolerans TaxID=1524096 RepID=A0A4Y8SMV3_9SPHI|nr:hypothetical protein E2R66_04840 [Mucilaginibacter psychrotolerans]
MYFDAYINHPEAIINPALLWEYDVAKIDYQSMRAVIVQRVIERGWPNDWYAMLNLYGIEGVKDTIKTLPYLNDKDMCFVSNQFNIPLSLLKCYEKKQSTRPHWNS